MRETRTEWDLAEALTALERHAPDPDRRAARAAWGARPAGRSGGAGR